MMRFLVLVVLVLVPPAFAEASDYAVTILKPDALAVLSREERKASTQLVGKTIAAIFGPISELRVEFDGGANRTAINGDLRKVQQRIQERIDRTKCLGREAEVAWHKAPWIRGHILLKNGRVLPVEILLSGIVVGDLLFGYEAEPTAPANGASPRR